LKTRKIFNLVVSDGLGWFVFDLPEKRANIFTREALEELEGWLRELGSRNDLRALVLVSAKPDIFIAGADVEEIADVSDPVLAESGSRFGHRLFRAWEELPFPTVAAIRGTCLGGGLELSLASTYRLVSDRPDLKIGLPEVQLGIIPGWGGCVRLPERVSLTSALDLILTGRTVDGKRAVKMGLADALLPDAVFEEAVRRWVGERLDSGKQPRRRSGLGTWLKERNPLVREMFLYQARRRVLRTTGGRYPAPLRALEVVAESLREGREAGFDAEARAIGELAVSPIAKNLIYLFRQSERARRDSEAGEVAPPAVERPAVIGAGVMGGGIALALAERGGLPVRLKDVRLEALGLALRHADEVLTKKLRRRRLNPREKRQILNRIQPTLEDAGLAPCDLIIEAVVEDLGVKQRLFADLARRVSDRTILATNTSSLSIDAIGQLTPHRERVVGMHFFNPVEKMPLVEVVASKHTSRLVVRTTAALARKLGKTPVEVRDAPGFLVNRLLAFYSAEAMWLLEEGYSVEAIDGAMTSWGMPMGPLRLADEVGLDVSQKVAKILGEAFKDRLEFPRWVERLPEPTALGVKSGLGFYRYRGRRSEGVNRNLLARIGWRPRTGPVDRELLVDRMLLPMVNEAARCLEERVVSDPGMLDLAMVLGTGFPPFRGGLCRWTDERGLGRIVALLEEWSRTIAPRLAPSAALRRLAEEGGFVVGLLAETRRS
jgi:3-hydroxyacyl-CoA dehydrogenase/enoyl-CoA hydratase/3-hydroxybutyryl-CoA epimerase